MSKYELVDFQTGASVQTRNLVFAGDLGPWEVKIDISSVKRPIDIDALKKSKPSSRKYLSLMPIKDDTNFVSLGEGATPVVKSISI